MTRTQSSTKTESRKSQRRSDCDELIAHGLSAGAASAVASIDATMVRIRRAMARREIGRRAIAELGLPIEIGMLEVMAVVHALSDEGEVTVGRVGEKLGVDPSRASRMVSDAVEAGLVRRVASQVDSRRTGLELTEAGRQHHDAVRAFKWELLSEVLGEWDEADLVRFATLFDRFSLLMSETSVRRR